MPKDQSYGFIFVSVLFIDFVSCQSNDRVGFRSFLKGWKGVGFQHSAIHFLAEG